MCDKVKDDFEFYTVKEFHKAKEKFCRWCLPFENDKNKMIYII